MPDLQALAVWNAFMRSIIDRDFPVEEKVFQAFAYGLFVADADPKLAQRLRLSVLDLGNMREFAASLDQVAAEVKALL